jgi:hypothetical protein
MALSFYPRPPSPLTRSPPLTHYTPHPASPTQLGALCTLPRTMRDAGVPIEDFTRHMAWLWSYMFEVLAPNPHPSGRMVLVADCKGIRLSLAMGEGQVRGGGMHLGRAGWRRPVRGR